MSRNIDVYLVEHVDLRSTLTDIGWTESADGSFVLQGRVWLAQVFQPSPVAIEDVPEAAKALRPGLAWYVSAGAEGSQQGERSLIRALRALAIAGDGVIVDENIARTPSGARRRLKAPPGPDDQAFLTMLWFSATEALKSTEGLLNVVTTINHVLPEALPARWDLDLEPPRMKLADGGIIQLADDLATLGMISWGIIRTDLITRTVPPFSAFNLLIPPCLGEGERNELGIRCLLVQVAATVLDQPGWGRRLAVAFRSISEASEPFYAEARIEPTTSTPDRRNEHVSLLDLQWIGFPAREPPLAMVVGEPYLSRWTDETGEDFLAGVLYSSEDWSANRAFVVPLAPQEFIGPPDVPPWWRRQPVEVPRSQFWPFSTRA